MAEVQFDRLKMYFGEPFDVGNGMTILMPTVGDILRLKDSDVTFYQTLYVWVANPTTYRLMLWDNGVDWNKLSDYELFLMLFKTQDPDVTKLMFGNIDFKNFDYYKKTIPSEDDEGNEIEIVSTTLYDEEDEIEISEQDYTLISNYLKAAFNIYPKVEKAKGRATKEAIIDEERMNIAQKAKDGNNIPTSSLLPLVSSCINHPGFKYNLNELREVNFVQFMDSVQRLQIYENSTALLRGSMSGFVDTSKINKDEFNFMRDISQK